MAIAKYLIDTSASARMRLDSVRDRLQPLLERGLAATCAILDLEAGYSAQSAKDYDRIFQLRNAVFEYVDTEEVDLAKALETQESLSKRSTHRGASLPDLIISAIAQRNGLVVLHYDHDYEIIADVTGQNVEWVVPKGSVDS